MRRDLAEILHEQKVDLVAHGIGSWGLGQKVLQQQSQRISIHERTGLQELAQLVNLDFLIECVQPLLGLLDRLRRGRICAGCESGTRRRVDHEFAGQCGINGMQAAGV